MASRAAGVLEVPGVGRCDRQVGRVSLRVHGLCHDGLVREVPDLLLLKVGSVVSGQGPEFESRNGPSALEVELVGDDLDVLAGLRVGQGVEQFIATEAIAIRVTSCEEISESTQEVRIRGR